MQARAGDDHCLCLPVDLVLHVLDEVAAHDCRLLVNGMRVQVDKRFEQKGSLAPLVTRVVLHLLQQPPIGSVGGIVLQDVEDEPLLDSLAHAVEMKRLERAVRTTRAEKLQRLWLGSRGEGKGGKIGQAPALLHLRQDCVFEFLFWRLGPGFLALRLF